MNAEFEKLLIELLQAVIRAQRRTRHRFVYELSNNNIISVYYFENGIISKYRKVLDHYGLITKESEAEIQNTIRTLDEIK